MTLQNNIKQINQLIQNAEYENHRAPGSVLLLAVSKQQGIQAINEAFAAGIRDFGENYYQEALKKINALNHLPVNWHFIGPVQSNKTKGIATHFHWVHSINRIKTAKLLNEHRPAHKAPLQICLQINLVNEETKSGATPHEAIELAHSISELPKLALRGLMIIPPQQENPDEQYRLFMQLKELMISLNKQLDLHMDTLSMGMSNDFIPAIKAGATIIRIGQALFGERTK